MKGGKTEAPRCFPAAFQNYRAMPAQFRCEIVFPVPRQVRRLWPVLQIVRQKMTVAGEVVVLPFPQTNLQAGKGRPALVVADLMLCQTTSQRRSEGFSLPLVATPEGILINLITTKFIRSLRGSLKRKPGDPSFARQWTEHKVEEFEFQFSFGFRIWLRLCRALQRRDRPGVPVGEVPTRRPIV